MSRNTLIAVIVAVLVIGGLGYVAYDRVLGDTEAASGPITAIPLATTAPAATEPTAAPEPTAAATDATPVPAATDVPAATSEPTTAAEPTTAPAEAAPDTALRYQIVADESVARFELSEDLRGEPFNVVGTTNQVVGELSVIPNDLSTTQLGVIQVNARTLATDSGQRDRAIRNFILNTDSYEFITFTPTSIEGLSGSGALNQPYTFRISGDLTIRDVTQPVVFDATVQAESADRLTGTATTTINRADYNLNIPDVPFVANVSEEVTLAIDFVAAAVE